MLSAPGEKGKYMAIYSLTIDGRYPSLNEFIDANRMHRQKGNQMKQRDMISLEYSIIEQLRKVHITKSVRIDYVYFEANKKRDLDNVSGYFHKIFQDALVNAGVLKNDTWQNIVGFSDTFYIDNKNPRIEIQITEME